MADPILVQEASTTFQNGPISPQVSQTSLYSSPELLPRVDSYQTGSSLGPGKTSDGLSSSFVLISDESHSGEQQFSSEYVEISERAAVVNKSSSSSQSHHDQATVANTTDPSSRIGSLSTNTAAKRGSEASHGTVKAASPLCLPGDAESATTASEVTVQKWLEESVVQHSTSPGVTVPMEMAGGLLPLKPKITSLSEVGTQTAGHGHSYVRKSRDGTTQTLPEIKDSKDNHQQPTVAATTPTSILGDHAGLDDQISPLNSPGDEVVDMSASTVLIERHISQKEGRMLKSNNKELRLKIKKLTDVLEQMQKENKRLKNEIESGPMKIAEAQSAALADKERECRRLIEKIEERQEMEIEQYRREIRKAAEYEEGAKEKLKENARLIAELQKTVSELQEQLVQAQDESKQHLQEVEVLDLKLKACETRASVTESENSVLNVKVNHLIKELTAMKKSKHHHHHHHQHSSDERSKEHPRAPSSSNGQVPPIIKGQSIEDIATKSGKEQELTKEEKLSSASQYQGSGGDDISKLEANLLLHDDLKASTPPKPKPRQKQSHQPHKPQLLQALAQTGSSTSASSAAGLTQKASKPDKQGRPPNRQPPVQALVAPKLQSVAHLQPLQQLPTGAKYGQEYLLPYYHHHDKQQQASKVTPPKVHGASVGAGAGAAAVGSGRIDRPSFLPLKGKSPPVPLQLVEHQAHVQPPPPLSEAQKLAATANWVQQLPEPKEIKQKIENRERKIADNKADKQKDEIPQASVLTVAGAVGGGNDLSSLSEERIEEITRQLKGDGGVVCECPICGKVLHSRESDYGVLLHVELCLQQAEAAAN